MKRQYIHFLSIACCLLLSLQAWADNFSFGYTNGDCGRSNNFRLGTGTTQGQAIRLSHEKLQLLKGCSISAIEFACGSTRADNKQVQLFISTALGADALVSQTGTIAKANQWSSQTLDNPYVITGEEPELYVGYTATIANTYNLLNADHTADLQGCCFVYNDGQWQDTYGMAVGAANVRAVIADAPLYQDVLVKPFSLEGYYKSNTLYTIRGMVLNTGSATITGMGVSYGVTGTEHEVKQLTGLNLAPGQSQEVEVLVSSHEGDASLDVEMGVDYLASDAATTADADPNDNSTKATAFFYPENMERSLLVESFTGQDCSNCPAGHRVLHELIDTCGWNAISVAHHSGYYPDQFTMDDDLYYTSFFFGSASTYAPAAMLNRLATPTMTSPIINAQDRTALASALSYMQLKSQPYVSLNLQSVYNPDTRQLDVTLQAYPHTDLPDGKLLLNVYLVQDSVQAYQSNGGNAYLHNAIYRGNLTGNLWGQLATCEAGKTVEWTTTMTLPESIYSNYWTAATEADCKNGSPDIPVVVKDMQLVAIAAAYNPDDNRMNSIYNAASVALNGSYTQQAFPTAIDKVEMEQGVALDLRVADGEVLVNGERGRCELFDLQGRSHGSRLDRHGVYLVRAKAAGKTVTRKIAY